MARVAQGRAITFDRSRGRGIVEVDGRTIVVDGSIVDASHLVTGDAVTVELDAEDRVTAVRLADAAAQPEPTTTLGLFRALLDAQFGDPMRLVRALVGRDDVHPYIEAWLSRWTGPIRFWEPVNVAEVVDSRDRDAALTASLESILDCAEPAERVAWVLARLRSRDAANARCLEVGLRSDAAPVVLAEGLRTVLHWSVTGRAVPRETATRIAAEILGGDRRPPSVDWARLRRLAIDTLETLGHGRPPIRALADPDVVERSPRPSGR